MQKNRANEVLTADGMAVLLFVGALSRCGIGVTGTWVGTLKFYGSYDGVTFSQIGATPFASGTDVSSTTANGSWFVNVGNYLVVKVVFTRTSGSAVVKLVASDDSAYQEAFLTAATIYATSPATSGANTLTQAAQANRAWKLKKLVVSLNAQPAWLTSPNLQIVDGSTTLWSFDLPPSGSSGVIYDVALPEDGIVGTPGNAMSIVMANPQNSAKSDINAEFGCV